MKKKIKDLTIEEIKQICDKYLLCNKRLNGYCQFLGKDISTGLFFCKKDDLEHYGDEEIEVEDDE